MKIVGIISDVGGLSYPSMIFEFLNELDIEREPVEMLSAMIPDIGISKVLLGGNSVIDLPFRRGNVEEE